MYPATLDFSGNAVTFFGLVGVSASFVVLISVFRSYWSSPYRR